MTEDINVSLTTDDDGFISQECPKCKKQFKAIFEEEIDRPISYCPYCGHMEQGCWWTHEQMEYFKGAVSEDVINPMLNDFAKDMNSISKTGDFLQISAEVTHDPPVQKPLESENQMPITFFECCNEKVKHDGSTSKLHCFCCGKIIEVS